MLGFKKKLMLRATSHTKSITENSWFKSDLASCMMRKGVDSSGAQWIWMNTKVWEMC